MAVFGDFLTPAGDHITAAVSIPGDLPGEAKCGVILELDRLVPTLARYLTDIAPPHTPDTAYELSPQALAVIRARNALRRAAAALRDGARSLDDAQTADPHPAGRHLSAAADHLAAGRDLLQTHFAEGPFGGWEGCSYWAPATTSRPVTQVLVSELAGYARKLAPWAARLSVTGTMDSGVPPAACLGLHAASRWLWLAGARVEAAHRQHPPSAAARRLLAAIPANLPIPRRPPRKGETIPGLCEQTIHTSERLRQLAWSHTHQASWAATSQSWHRAAYASAIVGHSSEFILRTLARRCSESTPASGHSYAPQPQQYATAGTPGAPWPANGTPSAPAPPERTPSAPWRPNSAT